MDVKTTGFIKRIIEGNVIQLCKYYDRGLCDTLEEYTKLEMSFVERQAYGSWMDGARYPEECAFDMETMRSMLKNIESSPSDFMVTAFVDGKIVGNLGVTMLRPHIKYRHRTYMGISIIGMQISGFCDI